MQWPSATFTLAALQNQQQSIKARNDGWQRRTENFSACMDGVEALCGACRWVDVEELVRIRLHPICQY